MTGNTGVVNGTSNMEIGQSNQDLIWSKNKWKKRNWIIASVVAIVIIVIVIVLAVVLSSGSSNEDPRADPQIAETINLEDFLNYRYSPESFNGSWVSGNQFLYTDSNGNLVRYNVDKDSIDTLLFSNDSIMLTAFKFELSADYKYLLVGTNYQKLYRHSHKAYYTIINLTNNNKIVLRGSNDEHPESLNLLLVEWAPVDNALVYVFENNIYYKESAESEKATPLTNADRMEAVLNGIPDWVYEEEVFSSNKALWFSPDGKKLAYLSFNDTTTQPIAVPIYGEPGSLYFQYPRLSVVRYPKAGTPNPTVKLFVVDLPSVNVTELLVPSNLESTEPLITAASWAAPSAFVAVWMNRVQNFSDIVVYEGLSGTPTIVKTISQTGGWVELFTPPKFSQDGSQMALLLPKNEGDAVGSFRHLALLDVRANSQEEFLTSGTYVITEILGWNPNNNQIFYTATLPSDSSVQHVYSISPSTKENRCLTCTLKSKNGKSDCLYNSAEVSTDSSYLVVTCGGPDIPYISVISTEGTEKLEWTRNNDLVDRLKGKTLHGKVKREFDIDDGFKARVMLKLPPNMDTSGKTKYPMVVYVYGGPDTYHVIDSFSLDWGSYLAANRSIIYAAIDGRGSGLRGNKLLFAGYRRLGTVEVIDQINVTKQIQQQLPYVDASRTAIWGWSYGGYAAGMALAMDTEDIFRCGMSVAPVTDWALYDSIYTERFMGLPTTNDNLEGYINAQLLRKYEGLKGKNYFLIHGTFDDNVHYQQSMMWAKVLERNDILFRQLSYTDEDHSLSSVRPHLYHSLESFLGECFT